MSTRNPDTGFVRTAAVLTVAVLLTTSAPITAQTWLDAHVAAGGGGSVSGATHQLAATFGQPAAGHVAGATHEAGIGFWHLSAAATTTSVGEGDLPLVRTGLFQNAPNPFNPMTTIRYAVGAEGRVTLALYDLQGRRVARLVDRSQTIGEYELVFRPRGLASGTYIYRLATADDVLVRRMVLLK